MPPEVPHDDPGNASAVGVIARRRLATVPRAFWERHVIRIGIAGGVEPRPEHRLEGFHPRQRLV
jgi:hypothetical protein